MNSALRVALYLVLVASTAFFGQRFLRAYAQRVEQAAKARALDENPTPAPPEPTSAAGTEGTNAAGGALTNAQPDEATNEVALELTNAPVAKAVRPPAAAAASAAARPPIGLYGAIALGSLIGLGLLVAYDTSHWVAQRTHRVMYNEEGDGFADPMYDQAEQVWANGDHLEALRLMREYLAKNPRQIHVAFRMAEIYEKDLVNHLAAALEYEEILKYKLSPDRWGWAAIHLCNLYGRLNQPDKVEALLRRIVAEYGDTPAAKKARERLGLPEDGDLAAAVEPSADEPSDGPKLPPGFRPKKR